MNMTGRLAWQEITLKLRNPFRVSYGVSDTRQAFWVRLAGDEGWGEGTIPPYYGVAPEQMQAVWDAAAARLDPFPEDIDQIPAWIGVQGPAPARCALDLALHDRLARRSNQPLYQLLGLPRPPHMPTSFTITIASPQEMADLARQSAQYPVIKIKLGSQDQEGVRLDVERLAAIRQVRPDARLRVDANAGWTPQQAVEYLGELEQFDLEMVEQPVARHDIAGMGFVQAHTALPVVADESVQSLADIEALARAGVAGVNLKLMKVGGLAPALVMLRRARQLGMKVMLGCMVETSLGVTAMLHLAGWADWLDLDAPLLISNDPFQGVVYDEQAQLSLPDRPGIGVVQC